MSANLLAAEFKNALGKESPTLVCEDLEEDEPSSLGEEITIEELKTVIREIKPNKSPGPDRIAAEIYKESYHKKE